MRATAALSLSAVTVLQVAAAQAPSGSLSGNVTDDSGTPLSGIPIRAINEASGTDARTFSAESGSYRLAQLPAGTYVVSISPPCCALVPYSNDAVSIGADNEAVLDIVLEEGGSLNTLGDDPGTIAGELRSRQRIPDRPVPQTADGHPDLSGVWLIEFGPFPDPARALPWAEAIHQQRIANNRKDDPHARCLPSMLPFAAGATPFIGKYVQTPDLLIMLFEDVPGFRQVFLDGREHPARPNPSWMGHSIGNWDGDTLVVDTTGFNDRGWTDVYPRTQMLRVTERYTRTEYGRMTVEITYDDPGVFIEPLVRTRLYTLAPQEELIEFVCENNKWGGVAMEEEQ